MNTKSRRMAKEIAMTTPNAGPAGVSAGHRKVKCLKCEQEFILTEQHVCLYDSNVIPPITDPMGRGWRQPDPKEILIDATHALMSRSAFDRLLDYSGSQPSGVYAGKMWKATGRADVLPDGSHQWYLKWFGLHPNPNMVSGHVRKILVVE